MAQLHLATVFELAPRLFAPGQWMISRAQTLDVHFQFWYLEDI